LFREQIIPILRKINQQCTAVEQEWIIRIILKGESTPRRALTLDLRISIREKGVFACFHPDAGDLFNVCSDLKRVCWTLYRPDIRLETHVSPGPSAINDPISKRTSSSSDLFSLSFAIDRQRRRLML
jgi:DNA ligase-4